MQRWELARVLWRESVGSRVGMFMCWVSPHTLLCRLPVSPKLVLHSRGLSVRKENLITPPPLAQRSQCRLRPSSIHSCLILQACWWQQSRRAAMGDSPLHAHNYLYLSRTCPIPAPASLGPAALGGWALQELFSCPCRIYRLFPYGD